MPARPGGQRGPREDRHHRRAAERRPRPRRERSPLPAGSAAPRSRRRRSPRARWRARAGSPARPGARAGRRPAPADPTRPARRVIPPGSTASNPTTASTAASAAAATSVPSTPRATGASRSCRSMPARNEEPSWARSPRPSAARSLVRCPVPIHSSSGRPWPGSCASRAAASVGSSATTKPAESAGSVGKRVRTPTTRAVTGRPSTVSAMRPPGPAHGGRLRVGEHRDGERVGGLGRAEHAGCSAHREVHDHGVARARRRARRRAGSPPAAQRHAQPGGPAGRPREQGAERHPDGGLGGGARVLSVLMAVRDGDAGGFVELEGLELPPSWRHGRTQPRGAGTAQTRSA